VLRLVLLALTVAAAAAAVNLVLLGYVGDRNDPVGKLSPVAPGLTASSTTPAAPVVTVTLPSHRERDD
jgi:hypothetical protein